MTVKKSIVAMVASTIMLGCSAKPDAAGICKKIEAAGIGKNCTQNKPEVINARAKTKYDFDLVRVPGEKGAVLDFATDDDYSATVNAYAALAMLAGPHRYGSPSTRIFVQMNTGASLDDGNAVRAIVGGEAVLAASPAAAPAKDTAAASATAASITTLSQPPQPAVAMSVCGKLAAVGAATGCVQVGGEDTAKFTGPGKGGLIMVIADQAKYQRAIDKKVFSGDDMTCSRSDKLNAFVCLMKGATPDHIKKTNAVVDGL